MDGCPREGNFEEFARTLEPEIASQLKKAVMPQIVRYSVQESMIIGEDVPNVIPELPIENLTWDSHKAWPKIWQNT